MPSLGDVNLYLSVVCLPLGVIFAAVVAFYTIAPQYGWKPRKRKAADMQTGHQPKWILALACLAVALLVTSVVTYVWPRPEPAPEIKTVTKVIPDSKQAEQIAELTKERDDAYAVLLPAGNAASPQEVKRRSNLEAKLLHQYFAEHPTSRLDALVKWTNDRLADAGETFRFNPYPAPILFHKAVTGVRVLGDANPVVVNTSGFTIGADVIGGSHNDVTSICDSKTQICGRMKNNTGSKLVVHRGDTSETKPHE